jgi:hypothetical protein
MREKFQANASAGIKMSPRRGWSFGKMRAIRLAAAYEICQRLLKEVARDA